jgi:copper chaperone CopZ
MFIKQIKINQMKSSILIVALAAFLGSCGGQEPKEGEVKETFTVYGNCGMCEKTIEGSLNGVKGVSSADWDMDTDEMTVVFDSSKISLKEVKEKIAGVGYDMDDVRADDEVYSKLHSCCQYERPE